MFAFLTMCFVQFLWKYVARKREIIFCMKIFVLCLVAFYSFYLFVCVLKVRNLPTLARRQVWRRLNMVAFHYFRYTGAKHSLPSSWSTYALGELSLEWYSSCLHVTVLHGNCMHGKGLACTVLLSFLRRRSFSWLKDYLLCRTEKRLFFMKNVERRVRIGELSTIFNLGS